MKLLKYLILSYLLFLNYSGAELVKADRYLTLENCRKTDTEKYLCKKIFTGCIYNSADVK